MKKESAESLLRKLISKEDADEIHAIYILAIMLERKKILVEKEVQIREDQTKLRIYEHKKTGDTFLVIDPELKLSEIEPIQEEGVSLLGGKSPTRSPNPRMFVSPALSRSQEEYTPEPNGTSLRPIKR